MNVVFVRHGAVRGNEVDPALTSYGHRMSIEVGAWLKSKECLPESFWSTPTKRTLQTAENILIGCGLKRPINSLEMTEFELSLEQIKKILSLNSGIMTCLFCCHQPLMEKLRNQYAPNSPPIRFASALIMRYSEGAWVYKDAWPGRHSY